MLTLTEHELRHNDRNNRKVFDMRLADRYMGYNYRSIWTKRKFNKTLWCAKGAMHNITKLRVHLCGADTDMDTRIRTRLVCVHIVLIFMTNRQV